MLPTGADLAGRTCACSHWPWRDWQGHVSRNLLAQPLSLSWSQPPYLPPFGKQLFLQSKLVCVPYIIYTIHAVAVAVHLWMFATSHRLYGRSHLCLSQAGQQGYQFSLDSLAVFDLQRPDGSQNPTAMLYAFCSIHRPFPPSQGFDQRARFIAKKYV